MLESLGVGLGAAIDPAVAIGVTAVYLTLLAGFFILGRIHVAAMPKLAAVKPGAAPPDCMVVIPARNEEGNIGRAVKSLPPDSVIVVDDCSEDGTAEEARRAGAGVLEVKALPKGVYGKPHACALGASALTTPWILFADADTWYEPEFLASAVQAAEAHSLDLVSFHLPWETKGPFEHTLVPYVQALFDSAINPRQSPAAAINGRCLLVRRGAYEYIGGHGVLFKHVAEDVKLAMLAVRHRMKVDLVDAGPLGHARLHRGWSGLWTGLQRNARRFATTGEWHGGIMLAGAVLGGLCLPVAAWLLAGGQPVAGAAIALAPVALLRPWYRSWIRALLAPLATLVVLPILANAAIRTLIGLRAQWKGRRV